VDFGHPEILGLLLLLPVLGFRLWRGRKRRERDWSSLAQSGRVLGEGSPAWLCVLACLIVALARPKWGYEPPLPMPPGHDVVFLVDTSRSMGVPDAVPNRLGAGVEAARSLVRALGNEPGDRAGVVAFAGRGVLRCPLTENLGAVTDVLGSLRPGDVRPGGTALGPALDAALRAFDEPEHADGRTIVLISDGEDLAGSWEPAVNRLRSAGVIVHAVAVGDAEQGHTVPAGREGRPIRWQRKPVLSKRSDAALEAVSRATGGALVRLGLAAVDLGSLYRERIAPIVRQKRAYVRLPERRERFPEFVLTALGFGILGCWPGWRAWTRLRVGVILLGVATLSMILGAGPRRNSPQGAIEAGQSVYAQRRFAAALSEFERAIALDPRAAVPRYDSAAALFQLGRYPEALARYREARERAGPALRTKIDYALGNVSLALGEVAPALEHYDRCLRSTARGADLDGVRRDAAVNRRFAEAQAQRAASSSSEPPEGAPPRPRAPQGKSSNSDNSKGHEGPEGAGKKADQPGEGEPGNRAPSGFFRTGGGGGSGSASRSTRPPEDRLATALNNIREAQQRRLSDEPATAADEQRKDW
jgi:Ca-activated chloride channel family protein